MIIVEFKGNKLTFNPAAFATMVEDYLAYVARDDAREVYPTNDDLRSISIARHLQSLLENT